MTVTQIFNDSGEDFSFSRLLQSRDQAAIVSFVEKSGLTDEQARELLYQAIIWRNAEIADMAIPFIADVNQEANDKGETFAYRAARFGCAEIIESLHARGADLDKRTNYGDTPMIAAAQCDQTEAVERLFFLGARPFVDKMGCSPQSWAMTDETRSVFNDTHDVIVSRVIAQKQAKLERACAHIDRCAHAGVRSTVQTPVVPVLPKLPLSGFR